MTRAEAGLLLLTCPLGDPTAPTLTPAQYDALASHLAQKSMSEVTPDMDVTKELLLSLGLTESLAERVAFLLDRDAALSDYLAWGRDHGITVRTALSDRYPGALTRLRRNAPAALFCKGDPELLLRPCVALVGSRQIAPTGRAFAEAVGTMAAKEGFVLASGGAPGADQAAQTACLRQGGRVIVFTPGRLTDLPSDERVLYCSEGGYDLEFTAGRALARNRLIHALAEKTFVAQCTPGKGGTWQGSAENLKHGWSSLFVFDDGSPGAAALMARGAAGIRRLSSLRDL